MKINGLTIENLILEGSISGLDNRNIAIKSAEITGSPGIDLDSSNLNSINPRSV